MTAEKIKISLAAARVNAGLTQAEVALKMKVSTRTLINWEKGHVVPSCSAVLALSSLYEIPVDNIFLPIKST